ncbi:magnesium-translocating P-type ATPase [Streptomyces sp. NPDC058246]|uniref:magnesium-translocating P-type ATPase n=1 Tax=Streptomyces sp. NPDC058246 TaxID=3346400 RepID=UPI0036EC6F8A
MAPDTAARGAGQQPPWGSASPADGTRHNLAALTSLQVLRHLDTGPRGLTEAQAEERLVRFGGHTIPERRTESWPRLFGRSLRDPFTAVLLCLGLVSAAVAAWGTACVILCLVVVSCALRASGEHRADRSMAGLRELVATTATVLRRADPDGAPRLRDIPVGELVPGDVIRIGPGDLVPADVRLLRASGLTVRQAALTGESTAVTKAPVDAPGPPTLSDLSDPFTPSVPSGPSYGGVFAQRHLCFQGSSVATGSGTAVVLATGAHTRLASASRGSLPPKPPARSAFDRSVHGISWVLIRFMLLTPPLVLMADAALRGRGVETLPFAVAVAVGLTPEMLPVIVTACLARGASLLARTHQVIVKRLPALHDLGAMDVLCLDKTGTLTQDRPVVHRALDGEGRDDPGVLRWAAVNAWWTLQLAELPTPDALDEALLDAADPEDEQDDGVAALPFDPVRRLATVVVRHPRRLGVHTLVVKGAVENVLERCVLEEAERARLLSLAARHADDGLRVLAVATAERPARTRARACASAHSHPYTSAHTPDRPGDRAPADERGLTFRGFVTFRDAFVPTAADALEALGARGVTVKILTGDHPGTAARACRDLGLDPGEVVAADRMDALSDAELAETVWRTTVFARCAPEHKARIAALLRADGHTVGFLGDGVNDLPALRAADVGIAPRDAVDVARESADVVLAEKDLTAIEHAVTAGRRSSVTIATYLRSTLSSNLGNVIAMLAAGMLLPFLPMLPAQVLAQNLCFDAAQLAFAYDRPHPDVLRRPTALRPRAFLRVITGFGALNAVADLATFGILAPAVNGPDGMDAATVFHSGWFTENLMTQALVMLLLRIGRRTAENRTTGHGDRRLPGPIGWAATGLAAAGVLLPASPLGPLLGMTALPLLYYVLLGAVLALYAGALTAVVRRAAG